MKKIRKKLTQRQHIVTQIEQRGGFFGELLPILSDEGAASLKTIINQVLREICKGDKDSALAIILRKQIQKAKAGDVRAAEFLFDRAYGKPTQNVNVTSPPVINVQHNVISVEEVKAKRDEEK